jgi:YD repeat-containing protein
MPVSYSTGIPNINIPLHTIKSGSIEVPIGLSYNASGIKVEEAPTWTGLGWNCNVGGYLSRVVQGLPDDFSANGYIHTTKTAKYILRLPLDSSERLDLLYNQANNGELDVEPDMYFFYAAGYSGKFYFDQTLHQFVMTPYQNIKISFTSFEFHITSFTLTMPNGVRCYFGISRDGLRVAYDKMIGQETTIISNGTISFPGSNNSPQHISSWQLMDILDTKNRGVSFVYESYSAIDFGRGGEVKKYRNLTAACPAFTEQSINTASYYKMTHSKSVLVKIIGENDEVNLITIEPNILDITSGRKRLEKIGVNKINGEQIKQYKLNYESILSDDSPALAGLVEFTENARNRTFLKSIKQFSTNNTDSILVAKFDYEQTIKLPSRFSASQDYWGFYNGKNNGIDLIPKVNSFLLTGTPGGWLTGSDRTVDTVYSKTGILKKITYPTGGSTEFQYESNRVSAAYTSNAYQGFQPSNTEVHSFGFYRSSQYQQPSDANYFLGTFSIGSVQGSVHITSAFSPCTIIDQTLACPTYGIVISGISNPSFSLPISNLNGDYYSNLPAGNYQIVAHVSATEAIPTPDFNVQLIWDEIPVSDVNNLIVGGLRVKRIIATNEFGANVSKTFKYNDFSDSNKSSGEIFNMPTHVYYTFCGYGISEAATSILHVAANSALPLNSPDGQLVRYTQVTEYLDENATSFKTEYKFSNDHYDFVNPISSNYPPRTNLQRQWRSGLELEKNEYEKIGSNYRLLKKTENIYLNDETRYEDTFGIKIAPYPYPNTFGFTPYSFVSEWYEPIKKHTIIKSYSSTVPNLLETTQDFTYNNQHQLLSEKTVNSKAEITLSTLKYPHDFSTIAPYAEMINKNIISPVIEQTQTNLSLNKEIAKSKVNYQKWNSLFIEPYTIQSSKNGNGLQTEQTIEKYDGLGNILQTRGRDGVVQSIVWGYQQTYPIVKVVGATHAELLTALSQTDDNLLYLQSLDNTALEIETNRIRTALALSNPTAQVLTYTYAPLVGMLTQKDANGKTVYYEYDTFNRLKAIRDQDHNIIKTFEYKYQQPQ